MDNGGIVSESKVDKSTVFESFYGKFKIAPLISDFSVNIECRLCHTLELGCHNLHVDEVIDVHVKNDRMTGGMPDANKIDPIVYAGQNYGRIGEIVSKAFSVGNGFKKP